MPQTQHWCHQPSSKNIPQIRDYNYSPILNQQSLHPTKLLSTRAPFLIGTRRCQPTTILACSMPIVQTASTALRDANDALLGVQCITCITTRPHFQRFSDPRFGALSPGKLRVHPLKWCLFASYPPHAQLTHFVRSISSSLAYRLAFVM